MNWINEQWKTRVLKETKLINIIKYKTCEEIFDKKSFQDLSFCDPKAKTTYAHS